MTWFRMSDRPGDDKPAIAISRDEAKHWNTPELGFGIFATVNSFNGPRRKEFLTRINAWAVDMDEGTKEQQSKRLLGAPLVPSLIVETERGYQAYWVAKDGKPSTGTRSCSSAWCRTSAPTRTLATSAASFGAVGYLHLKDPERSVPGSRCLATRRLVLGAADRQRVPLGSRSACGQGRRGRGAARGGTRRLRSEHANTPLRPGRPTPRRSGRPCSVSTARKAFAGSPVTGRSAARSTTSVAPGAAT